MLKIAKRLSIAAVTTALLATSPIILHAEDSSHESHHPADAATKPSQVAKPDTASPSAAPGDGKMGGGMMDGERMSKMKTMMQSMHEKMMGDRMPKGDSGPSSLAFNGIIMKMYQEMGIIYTGNPDVDFVNAMIPYHQGAIDMAKTELAFGKDADVKKMAEGVIKAREAEIAGMQDWLKTHDK